MKPIHLYVRPRELLLAVLGAFLFLPAAIHLRSAEQSAAAAVIEKDPQKELEQLRKEIEKLQAENILLKKENQAQRKMLGSLVEPTNPAREITQTGFVSTNPAPVNPISTNSPSTKQTNDVKVATTAGGKPTPAHWLSSTGKRHNSVCRYYKYPGGSPCGPDEGTACKLCGG